MKQWWKKVERIAEKLGWNVIGSSEGNDWLFSIFSPCDQDCNMEVFADTYEDLVNEIQKYYEDYDASYEAYLWLDNTGHGINGAPYEMIDVYNEMKWFEEKIEELGNALFKEIK